MGLPYYNLKLKRQPIKTGHLTVKPVGGKPSRVESLSPSLSKLGFTAPAQSATERLASNGNLAHILNDKPTSLFGSYLARNPNKYSVLIPRPNNRHKNYSNDKLDVSDLKVSNRSFDPIEIDQNISRKRPEMLIIYNFSPIFLGDPKNNILSPIGKLIEIQHQASYIKRDTISEITLNIQKASTDKDVAEYGKLLNSFNKKLNDLESLLTTYNNLHANKEEIKQKFNIKTISSTVNPIDKFVETLFGATGNTTQFKAGPSIKEFCKRRMGYTETQFNGFTNTKIYIQLLADLKNIIDNYSFNLLDLKDSDRPNDSSATVIDRTYTTNDGFSFNVSTLRSNKEPINAINLTTFNKILSSLPTTPASRIKILINTLSKEYRISSELGDPNNRGILSAFGIQNFGTPFDNILGLPGPTIFDLPRGDSSLLSMAQFEIDKSIQQSANVDKQDFFVLPFEDKFVDFDKTDKTYVPGNHYFVDTIFETKNNAFNLAPLTNFQKKFSTKFKETEKALTTLLQLDTKNSLDVEEMFYSYINACNYSINDLSTDSIDPFGTDQHKVAYNVNQAIVCAIFRMAAEDNKLKNYLFQYLLLSGLASNNANNSHVIWQSLINELISLDNFTALSYQEQTTDRDLRNGPGVVKYHLQQLAKTIENYISDKILGSNNRARMAFSGRQGFLHKTSKDPNAHESYMDESAISTALTVEYNASSNTSNFCKEFLKLAEKFTSAAGRKGAADMFLVDDKSGRTRYNFISTSCQLLIMFECLVNFANLVSKVELARTANNDMAVRIYGSEQKALFGIVSDLLTGRSLAGSVAAAKNSTSDKIKSNLNDYVSSEKGAALLTKAVDSSYQKSTLNNIVEKLKQEDLVVVEALAILRGVNDNITTAKEIAEGFSKFTTAKNADAIVGTAAEIDNYLEYIETVKDTNSELGSVKTKTAVIKNLDIVFKLGGGMSAINAINNNIQLRNSAYILRNLKDKALNLSSQNKLFLKNRQTNQNENIVFGNEVKTEIKDVLYSFLATQTFTETLNADTKMKIFSVGIPTDFSKGLVDRISINTTTKGDLGFSSFQKKQTDVIKVKVYKRNLQYDDLVFKPKEFVFDLSLYVTEKDIIDAKPTKGELYNNIIQRMTVSDFENMLNPEQYYLNKTKDNKKAIATEQKYSFLSKTDKNALFANHVQSYLLSNLLYLATGLTVTEESFLQREDAEKLKKDSFDTNFSKILQSYITNVLKEPVPENQSLTITKKDKKVSQSTKEMIKLFESGNYLCNPNKLYYKTFGRRFFDRVFHVPVDIDSFEIDLDETKKTASGRNVLNKAFLEKNIVNKNGKSYLKPRTDRDIILEDFFINIETTT
jgi:hypothetical protein